MPTALRSAESALDALERLADAGLPSQELLEQASERIERVVPVDGRFLSATDPATTFVTGTAVVRDLPPEWCAPTWDYEFLVPDVLKYADLARSGRGVADVHDATGGRPQRSVRFRHFSADTGFDAELRLAFSADGATWGIGQLNRANGRRFSADEKAWLERAVRPVARGLRRALLEPPAEAAVDRGPGVVVVDAAGELLSATPQAHEWFAELHPELVVPAGGMPFFARGLAVQARAAHQDGLPAPRARLRTQRGVWLLMHCSPLAGTDQLVLIIEPAKSGDVAPLIVEAYGLSARELDVARAIARGLRTAEVAERLHLSPHTVRDHVKAIFEKVGVSSRGELVHRLFAEHYAPTAH